MDCNNVKSAPVNSKESPVPSYGGGNTNKSAPIGAIIGGVLGGLILLTGILTGILFLQRRKQHVHQREGVNVLPGFAVDDEGRDRRSI